MNALLEPDNVNRCGHCSRYSVVTMSAMASQITVVSIVNSTVCSGDDKKTSKFRVTGHCEGNPPVTGEFPAQRVNNTENVYIWWRYHETANGGTTPHSSPPTTICGGSFISLGQCHIQWSKVQYIRILVTSNYCQRLVHISYRSHSSPLSYLFNLVTFLTTAYVISRRRTLCTGVILLTLWIFRPRRCVQYGCCLYFDRLFMFQGPISLTIFPSQFKFDGNFI